MAIKLEEKKKKIDEQIKKNLLRKKMLINKEKRKRAARFNDIGKLAYQANIDQIDEKVLLGAFLEISKNINEEKISSWKIAAEKFSNTQSKEDNQTFSISFVEDPSLEIKKKLKEMKFQWNRFRKEFYGKCRKPDIENLLKDCKFKIEEIID